VPKYTFNRIVVLIEITGLVMVMVWVKGVLDEKYTHTWIPVYG
jgi:hypothetical protein